MAAPNTHNGAPVNPRQAWLQECQRSYPLSSVQCPSLQCFSPHATGTTKRCPPPPGRKHTTVKHIYFHVKLGQKRHTGCFAHTNIATGPGPFA
jgi:hypothetical protein